MKRMQKNQAGFTILEIGIVMIILVSLVVTFSSSLWQKQEAADRQILKLWFSKVVPEAVATCRMKYSNTLDITKLPGGTIQDGLQACGLDANTMYGGGSVWTAVLGVGQNTSVPVVVITYPLAGMADITTEAPFLATLIEDEGGASIEDADISGSNLLVEVKIR